MRRPRVDDNSVMALIAIVMIVLAALLRLSVRAFESGDFIYATGRWYAILQQQGWSAFAVDFYNHYPPAYPYTLYLISRVFPWMTAVLATKLPSLIADFVCAWYAYRMVRLRYGEGSPAPGFAALAILFAPTVVVNSAVWGQCDMLFTAPLVACLYYVLRRRETAAWVAFSLAFTVKLQTIFLAPFLLVLLLRRELPWRKGLLVPAIFFVSVVPAWMAGRPLFDVLTTYKTQAEMYKKLTANAPTLYAWLPQQHYELFTPAGVIFGGAICLFLVLVAVKSRVPLTPTLLVGLALASVLITPYVLPRMHDRYFFPADIFSILFAFYVPAYVYLPLLIGMVSFFAYQPYLFRAEIVPMPWLALALLAAVAVVTRWVLGALYPEGHRELRNVPSPSDESASS
jgi:Gpi18-like mannosyltransferase